MLCEFDAEPSSERMRRAVALAGDGSVGMGFFGHWMHDDLGTFERAADALRVVEVFWTAPDPSLVERARRSGDALVAWQVGSATDARAAQDAGCDFVVAQGIEAGGHVRGTTPREVLLEAVRAAVSIPVVVAGGIANAADVARAIEAGASGVRVGTAFVATVESGGHPAYVNALLAATSGDDTVLTTAFSEGWPDAPHRVLTSALAAAEAYESEIVGEAGDAAARYSVSRFSVATPDRNVTGHIEAMALYAGMGVGEVNAIRPAGELVSELVSQLA